MRLILCFLLVLIAAPAWAHLDKATENDGAVVYIDHHTIRKNGNLVRVWEVQDLKKRDPDGEMSRRTLVEYDCRDPRTRSISMSTLSGPMGTGRTIWFGNNPSGEWSDIPRGTPAADIRKIVCSP